MEHTASSDVQATHSDSEDSISGLWHTLVLRKFAEMLQIPTSRVQGASCKPPARQWHTKNTRGLGTVRTPRRHTHDSADAPQFKNFLYISPPFASRTLRAAFLHSYLSQPRPCSRIAMIKHGPVAPGLWLAFSFLFPIEPLRPPLCFNKSA